MALIRVLTAWKSTWPGVLMVEISTTAGRSKVSRRVRRLQPSLNATSESQCESRAAFSCFLMASTSRGASAMATCCGIVMSSVAISDLVCSDSKIGVKRGLGGVLVRLR
jgi:hypothetical protein